MRWLALVALLPACNKGPERHVDKAAADKLFDEVTIPDAPPGISDLTIDDHGVMWAVPERNRFVLELGSGAPKQYVLAGVPEGMDTEALTWLSPGHFALGLEHAHEAVAGIAWANLDGDHVVVEKRRMLTSNELGVQITDNHGIEGVCGHGDDVLAASESVIKHPDGSRWAALVRIHGDDMHIAKLKLTSDAGKISALYCTFAPDGTVDVTAIERHFGVCRIVTFQVHPDDTEVTAAVELDLEPVLHDSFNLEGLTKLPDGRMVLVNDNQSDRVVGPTELLYFHPR